MIYYFYKNVEAKPGHAAH